MIAKKKKHYPPNTFLPMPQRILAILQLCISFCLLLWLLFQPFMGEYFQLRSKQILYDYILSEDPAERFNKMNSAEQEEVLAGANQIQKMLTRPAAQKMREGLETVLFGLPPFELAWIIFSIIISIMLLKKVEGARAAVWILPLICMAYIIDNRISGHPHQQPADYTLFPTEESLTAGPLSGTPNEQMAQLKKEWENYLVNSWSKLPADSPWQEHLADGEFHFTLARVKLLSKEPLSAWKNDLYDYVSYPWLLFYFAWNLLFAWKQQSICIEAAIPVKTNFIAGDKSRGKGWSGGIV